MKDKIKLFVGLLSLFIVLITLSVSDVSAQYQDGHNLDFSENGFGGWRCRVGKYQASGYYGCSNPLNNAPWDFTQTTAPCGFSDHPEQVQYSGWGSSGDGTYFFKIYSNLNEYDEHSQNGLKKVPSHLGYTHSARLNHIGSNSFASELSYPFTVTEENCLLSFNFAMVLEAPHPDEHYPNPAFEVDVVEVNGSSLQVVTNNGHNGLVDDCTIFKKSGDIGTGSCSSTPCSQLAQGWHCGTSGWIYCDWQQIKVNLRDYAGLTVMVRARVSDCIYGGHGGYGYFVASLGPPDVTVAGCSGNGDTVTTVSAPANFAQYRWFEIPQSIYYDQFAIEQYASNLTANQILGRDSVFAVRNAMMNGQTTNYFAVELVSPTQSVSWETPAPACKTYIPATVHDMRPNFDQQHTNRYKPIEMESVIDDIGFRFADVRPSAIQFPMDWQSIDFGDGDTLELVYNTQNNKWEPDPLRPVSNITRLQYSYSVSGIDDQDTAWSLDTIWHTYNAGNYIYNRCAHVTFTENGKSTECQRCDTLQVYMPLRPSFVLLSEDTVCLNTGATIHAVTSDPEALSSDYIYQWWWGHQDETSEAPFHTDTVLRLFDMTVDTVVKVKVTTPDDFYRWRYDTIRVQSFPNVKIEGDSIVCAGQVATLSVEDLDRTTVGMQWSLTRPYSLILTNPSTNPSVTFAPGSDTTAYILAETSKHCISYDSVRIKLTNPKLSADKTRVCPGQSVILTGEDAYGYTWSSEPENLDLEAMEKSLLPVEVAPEETTVYIMKGYGPEVEDGESCYTERRITVTVIPYPVARISASPMFVDTEDPVVTFTDSSTNSVASYWTFSDGITSDNTVVNHKFTDLTNPTVEAHLVTANVLGCTDSADISLPVELFAVWVPNAFTPDGDGVNDYFFFMTENKLNNVKFEIYDRWGTKLYTFQDGRYDASFTNADGAMQRFGWDGTYKNEYVDNGSYVWRLTYQRDGSTRVYDKTGIVNVVR